MGGVLEVRRLRQSDLLGKFRSGHHDLDYFLKKWAALNDERELSSTWLAFDGTMLVGYATVVAGCVDAGQLKSSLPDLPPYEAPVLLLARMATDKRHQGKGVGKAMMRAVYAVAHEQGPRSGCVGVYTHAKAATEKLQSPVPFYRSQGFVVAREPTADDATTGMFLALSLARQKLGLASAPAPELPDHVVP